MGGRAHHATSIFDISRFSLSIPRFAISFFANRDQWAWRVGAKNAHEYYARGREKVGAKNVAEIRGAIRAIWAWWVGTKNVSQNIFLQIETNGRWAEKRDKKIRTIRM
jgi:hypothetical protein